MKEQGTGKFGRRDFLRVMGFGAGMAAAAAVPLTIATEAEAAELTSEAKKARYNSKSEDVKNYYRVNGYDALK
jgi:hypothetical protein